MTVHDLNTEELEELRDRYFHELLDSGEEVDYDFAWDIPMEKVITEHEHYHFCTEDFWCNLERE